MSLSQGHTSSIYSPSCDTFRVGSLEPHSRNKRKHSGKFRRIFAICHMKRQLETLYVLSLKITFGFWLKEDRPLEVLNPHLWLTSSPILRRRKTWNISKASLGTLQALSSSVCYLFLDPLATKNPLCSCCRHNTFSHTYHICSDDFLPRGTVKGAACQRNSSVRVGFNNTDECH